MATATFKAVNRLHPALRMIAYAAATAGVLGLILGVLGWIKPVTESPADSDKAGESMTFSYSAEVPRSAVYDGTTAYSPDPIFRKLAQIVDLSMNYRGKPGRVQVLARLSAQNGWHKTVQLSQPKQFAGDRYSDKVQLDLPALERIAADAGIAIGADMGPITLAITVPVQHNDGTTFEPQIQLNLAPLQLVLMGGAEGLVIDRSDTAAGATLQDRQIGAFGYRVLTASEARTYAIYLLLVAFIGALVTAMMALRHVPLRTRTQIQRRYPHLLVPVEPMASPPGKPVVIVDTFPALVKLAEKYGQMILTWTRPDGSDDFVVRDEGILYRYRIEAVAAAPAIPAHVANRAQADEVVSESTPLPTLQLPPAPEPPPELRAEPDGPTSEESADAADVEATPIKKAAPRKRASRTTAAKTAAAKTAAAKAAPTKRTATKAPAKRARAQAKPATEPEPTEVKVADQPTPAGSDIELVPNRPEIGEQAVTSESSGTPDTQEAPVPVEAIVDSVTEATRTAPDERLPEPEAVDESPAATGSPEAKSDSVQPEPAAERPQAGETADAESKTEIAEGEPPEMETQTIKAAETESALAKTAREAAETDPDAAETGPDTAETGPAPAETAAKTENESETAEATETAEVADVAETAAAVAEPETAETLEAVEATAAPAAAPRPTRSQKRASRRKSRSRKATQPAVDEPTTDRPDLTSENTADVTPDQPGVTHETAAEPAGQPEPAERAREAMKNLAERNRPIAAPKPEPKREPIYDFLPAAKQAPSRPDLDDDIDDA